MQKDGRLLYLTEAKDQNYYWNIPIANTTGDSIALVGFGTFAVKARAERTGRNPQTGQENTIAATNVPSFKPCKGLKDAVNG